MLVLWISLASHAWAFWCLINPLFRLYPQIHHRPFIKPELGFIGFPNPSLLGFITSMASVEAESRLRIWSSQFTPLKEHGLRYENLFKELCCNYITLYRFPGDEMLLTSNALRVAFLHGTSNDLTFEGAEDDHPKLDCEASERGRAVEQSLSVPFTLTLPVPFPIKPSEAFNKSYMQMQSPTFCTT